MSFRTLISVTIFNVMFVVDLCSLRVLNTTDREKYSLYPDTKAASEEKWLFFFSFNLLFYLPQIVIF